MAVRLGGSLYAPGILPGGGSGPPPLVTLLGASVELIGANNPRAGHATESTQTQANTRFETASGVPLGGVRVYDSGHGAAGLLSTYIPACGKLGVCSLTASMSYKTAALLSSFQGGTYDSDVNSLLTYLTANRGSTIIYLVFNHEFDSNIAKSDYTFAQFYPAWNHFAALVAAHGDAGIVCTTIYTGSSFSTRWASYNPSMTGIQAVFIDPYQTQTTQTAQSLCQTAYNLVNAAGFQFGIGEIASRLRSYTLTVPGGVTSFTLKDASGNVTSALSASSTATQILAALTALSNGATYAVTGTGPFTVSYTVKSEAPAVNTSVGGTATLVLNSTVATFVSSISWLVGLAALVLYYNTGANQTSQPSDDDQIDDDLVAIGNWGAL